MKSKKYKKTKKEIIKRREGKKKEIKKHKSNFVW
jgi:hypothetical protein